MESDSFIHQSYLNVQLTRGFTLNGKLNCLLHLFVIFKRQKEEKKETSISFLKPSQMQYEATVKS